MWQSRPLTAITGDDIANSLLVQQQPFANTPKIACKLPNANINLSDWFDGVDPKNYYQFETGTGTVLKVLHLIKTRGRKVELCAYTEMKNYKRRPHTFHRETCKESS